MSPQSGNGAGGRHKVKNAGCREQCLTRTFIADDRNQKVYILLRETMEILTSFGDGGRQTGQFYAVHSIATDSKDNIYTTETYEGRRLQKFVYKGLAPVTKQDQGTVWPTSSSK